MATLAPVEKEGISCKFPVQTNKKSMNIHGNPTDVLCSVFKDKFFIIITQYRKLGNLVHLTRESAVDDQLMQSNEASYFSQVLLGNDEPLTHVLAKNLMKNVKSTKPILLAMALKDVSRETVIKISKEIPELLGMRGTQ